MLNAQVLQIRDQVTLIHKSDTLPTLSSLLSMATSIWQSNNQLMDMLAALKERLPAPDLDHTWAQAPVLLEDALGRHITIPSEYDWEKLQAIIQVQFRRGPGSAKVKSGEYELFDALNYGAYLLPWMGLRPGMRVKMAIVIGRYECYKGNPRRCPKTRCPGTLRENSVLSMEWPT